ISIQFLISKPRTVKCSIRNCATLDPPLFVQNRGFDERNILFLYFSGMRNSAWEPRSASPVSVRYSVLEKPSCPLAGNDLRFDEVSIHSRHCSAGFNVSSLSNSGGS